MDVAAVSGHGVGDEVDQSTDGAVVGDDLHPARLVGVSALAGRWCGQDPPACGTLSAQAAVATMGADGASTWPDYVFDHERGWYIAASWGDGPRHARLLGDKAAAAKLMASVGLATVPSLLLPRQSAQADWQALVDDWLHRWPRVHGKRRSGSRGVGAFELERASQPGTSRSALRAHQAAEPVQDPWTWLSKHAFGHDYLVQPRLTSHRMFDGIADDRDVVTIRVVTRDCGAGPEVCCAWLELPLPVAGAGQYYLLLRLTADGEIAETAVPPWLRPDDSASEDAVRPTHRERSQAALADRLRGLVVPDFAALTAAALRAHE